jgi:hypothetical protein
VIRLTIGGFVVILGIGLILWSTVPRLWTDYQYADEFVPARNLKLTRYQCTNWDLAVANRCAATFQSTVTHATGEITDWRFGRAPTDRVVLLQRRDDPSAVTTDVSLRTLWNRIALAGAFALFGLLAVVGFVRKMMLAGGRPSPATARLQSPSRRTQ